MPITDAHALRQAGRLFSKAVFNQKIPLTTIRSNYDSILGTVSLPNNMDRQEVDTGPVPADLLIPELAMGKRTILYAHGGSFISGSRNSARNLCASLAHESASKLLLPEYRLAPEHPFPAALDDMFASYMWLLHQGIPSGDIIFAGDGTGANLMLSLVHMLGDKRISRPAAVIAISPWVDLACESAIFTQRKNPDPVSSTAKYSQTLRLQYTVHSNFAESARVAHSRRLFPFPASLHPMRNGRNTARRCGTACAQGGEFGRSRHARCRRRHVAPLSVDRLAYPARAYGGQKNRAMGSRRFVRKRCVREQCPLMELVSPAGNIEKLTYAWEYGADAAYIGLKKFSLRVKADNFYETEFEDIKRLKKTYADAGKAEASFLCIEHRLS